MPRQRLLLFFVLSAAAQGCGSRELSVPAAQAFPPHFAMIRDRILKPRCAACHTAIVQYTAVARASKERREGTSGPLYNRIYEQINSGEMPQYGGKLPQVEIDAIKAWIDAGAIND